MPDYAVSTAFTARDKVSPAFNAMGRNASKFGGKAAAAFNQASKSGDRFRSVVKGILAASVIQRGVQAIGQGVATVVGQFIEFDDAIVGAAARFKDIGPDSKNFDQQLQAIKQSAREAGATTKYTAAQAAAGLDFLARAGFSSAEAMGSLVSMINLATATGEDFAAVADYSSDLLGAFGLAANTTAEKIASLNRLNDVLVRTANTANIKVEDMFETMKTAGPVSQIYRYSLESVAAATAVLGNAGIKGTEAATVLKNAMLRLADPNIQKQLIANGVALTDSAGNMRDFAPILADISKKIKKLGTAKQAAILNDIFGLRAIAGSKTMMKFMDSLTQYEKELENASGISKRTAERIQQSLGNRLLSLGSAATEFGFRILEAFEVKGKRGIDALTTAIRDFDVKPIVQGLQATADIISTLYAVIKPILPILPYLIGGFAAWSAIMKGIALGAIILEWLRFYRAVVAVSGAMGVLDVIMAANPIGLMVAGVVALVAAFIYLEKRFGFVEKGFEMLKTGFVASVGFMKSVYMRFASFVLNNWAWIITTIVDGASRFGSLIGLDTSGLDALSARVEKFRADVEAASNAPAPNAGEAEARRIQFQGQINIAGAPAGTTATGQTTGAPPVQLDVMGPNH